MRKSLVKTVAFGATVAGTLLAGTGVAHASGYPTTAEVDPWNIQLLVRPINNNTVATYCNNRSEAITLTVGGYDFTEGHDMYFIDTSTGWTFSGSAKINFNPGGCESFATSWDGDGDQATFGFSWGSNDDGVDVTLVV
jgi:hypothetical protein